MRCNQCRTHEAAVVKYKRKELPDAILPSAYELHLDVQLDACRFDGEVYISLDVRQEGLTAITLHAVELAFKQVQLVRPEEGSLADWDAESIVTEPADGTATFTFAAPVPVGPQRLRISYSVLNDKMDGFYRSTYTDRQGKPATMASTFFCATTARKCLPCWDEPLRKATFTCSLTVPSHMTALSNMPERDGHEDAASASPLDAGGARKTVHFAPTPRMSSYLLCFVVSELDATCATSASGVLCRVFTPPGKAALGQWALEHAALALDRFAELFGVPYPLPKADLVAIPDFAMGAMENWGLVTYRETKLLLAPEGASASQRQAVAETVVHEVAHQWFGNLVTMSWWDDIWLNEGFATWMEQHVNAATHPEWHIWTQFVAGTQGGALTRDALRSSHPIQMPLERAEMVDEAFDAISYLKGASVIRMLHAVVGEAAFFGGLRAYIRSFTYGNATTADLWAALSASSGSDIGAIAGDWTRQKGFPLITLEAARPLPRDGGGIRLMVKQEWYLSDGSTRTPMRRRRHGKGDAG